MKPWHPVDPDTQPDATRLRELQNPKEIAEAQRILERLMKAKPERRLQVLNLDPAAGRREHKRMVYNAVGMYLWRQLVETDEIDKSLWKVFVRIVHHRDTATRGLMMSNGKRSPFFDLMRKVLDAQTPEEAADILRSIAPEGAAVLSET